MTTEYIEHAVGAEYVRLQEQRYRLKIDLRITNNTMSFPQRPIPLDVTDETRSNITQKMNYRRAKEYTKIKLDSLNEQLENGSIGTWQYKEAVLEMLNEN